METDKVKLENLKERCFECKNLIEIKKILFEIAKLKGNAKSVTGITQEAIEEFDKNQIIKICQNVDSKDRTEALKMMKLSNIAFEDILAIFDKEDLLKATKEFNVKVTKEDLQQLYENAHDNGDKHFIQLLMELNPSEKKTITEIVLENFKGSDLIDIIREYNIKLNSEQLELVLNQDESLGEEQEKFVESLYYLSKKNQDLANTINYKILGGRYGGLEKQLPIITCHPDIQEQIIGLNDHQLQVLESCIGYYSGITSDWTPVADGILKNISKYSDLFLKLSENDFRDSQKMELLIKIISEPNYFEIKDLDSYLEKRFQMCNEILENTNGEIVENNEYLSSLSELDRIKFAILEKNYGLSLEQANELVKKFADAIDTLNINSEEAQNHVKLIKNISNICNCEDIEELRSQLHTFSNEILNVNLIERRLKDLFDKEYAEKLYRPTESDSLSQSEVEKYLLCEDSEGIDFYLAGKSTNGQFFMESHAPGAVYSDDMLTEQQYARAWNKPLMRSQAFCTHLTSNQMLFSNIRDVEYGFYQYEEGSLRAAGNEDISSDYTHFRAFTDDDERLSSMQYRIDHTRNNDESDRARYLKGGTKKQPDYIRLLVSRHIKPEMARRKLEHAKLASKQFEIPIVIIDQDECTKKENKIIRNMIEELGTTQDASLIPKIMTRFENNRVGNLWNGKDFAIDSDFQKNKDDNRVISRNEMITSIINIIKECSEPEIAKQLYSTLESSIKAEVAKAKRPGYKILNDKGIPVVQKESITIEEYFGMKRDKETGELIPETAISAYSELGDLRSRYGKKGKNGLEDCLNDNKTRKLNVQEATISTKKSILGNPEIEQNNNKNLVE